MGQSRQETEKSHRLDRGFEQVEVASGIAGQPKGHRRAFLGHATIAMLTTAGIVASGCKDAADAPPSASPPSGKRPVGNVPRPERGSALGRGDKSVARNGAGKEGGNRQASRSNSIEQRVLAIVAEQVGAGKGRIQPSSRFVKDLGCDSLDTVELVMEFEEEFDITIPDAVAEKIQTVQQAIDYIESALRDKPAR